VAPSEQYLQTKHGVIRLESQGRKAPSRVEPRQYRTQSAATGGRKAGLSATLVHWSHHAIGKPSGLGLITGATGSGKSTTLASVVDYINRTRPCNIVTLEDPIEFLYPAGPPRHGAPVSQPQPILGPAWAELGDKVPSATSR